MALTERIQPVVVETLLEIDFDVSRKHPQLLIAEDSEWADVVVTMGCQDSCPTVAGKYYLEWDLPDPAGMDLDQARQLREQVGARVKELADELPDDVRSFRLADKKHTFRLAGEPDGQSDEVRSFKRAAEKHSFRER